VAKAFSARDCVFEKIFLEGVSQSTALIEPRMDFALRYGIFKSIADALQTVRAYRGKIRYGFDSMCIKVDLGIKIVL
jgi:hypothetical protein